MAAREVKISLMGDYAQQPPRSFGAFHIALFWANTVARQTGVRRRIFKGASGRWLVTVVRP